MPFLIIEASSHLAPAHSPLAYVQSVDGQAVTHSGHSAPALLPKPGKGTEVVLVLPVQDVSWHRVTLPQISLKDRVRLRAVLHGLLEDQLLEDPELLHFALAPEVRGGQPCWVAVCDAQRLQQQLQTLEQHGVVVQRIVPAFAPASSLAPADAEAPVALYALGSEDAPWLVVTGAVQRGGTRQEAEPAGVLAVPLSASAAALEPVAGADSQTPLWAEPAVFQLAQQRLGRPAQLLAPGQRLLQASQSGWNMAQFQFANSGRDRFAQHANAGLQTLLQAPQWRWVRHGAVLLVLVQLVGLNAWAWQARRDLEAQRAQIQQIFSSTFPRVPVVMDAPLQMRQELQRLQQRSGALTPASFEVLAAASGPGLPPARLPTEIRYEDGVLTLLGLPQDDPDLQQWQAALGASGLLTRWQEGALLIEPAAAGRLP